VSYSGHWVVLAEPASEPVTVDLARRHCRIDADYDDDLVAFYIASARSSCEQWLGRAFFTQKRRYSITWAPPPTATPLVPQSLVVFPLNWPPLVKRPIEVPFAPLQSVDTITWGPVGNMTTADPEDYDVNAAVEPGYVSVKPQLLPRIPQQSMVIDYTAGYDDADPAKVPAPLRHAILLTVAYHYENRGDVENEIPKAAKALMWPYRLWTFAG